MSDIQDLISQIPLGDLAQKLGVDEATANDVVQKAIPALLSGMQANAESGGASSLEKALSKHSSSLLDGGVDLDQVDTEDGKKIVAHVFGGSRDQVATALGQGGGGGLGGLIGKAWPILAPIVMSYLAQQFTGQKTSSKKTSTQADGGDDLLGGVLGGLLGGGSGGGGLGDLLGGLGGLLGGGSK